MRYIFFYLNIIPKVDFSLFNIQLVVCSSLDRNLVVVRNLKYVFYIVHILEDKKLLGFVGC